MTSVPVVVLTDAVVVLPEAVTAVAVVPIDAREAAAGLTGGVVLAATA